jgi:hypothetical protein
VHAARLMLCWQENGDQFPVTFSQVICPFLMTLEDTPDGYGGHEWEDKINIIGDFLTEIFAGKDPYHVCKAGAEELWVQVLDGLLKNKNIGPGDSQTLKSLEPRIKCLLDAFMTWSRFKIPPVQDEEIIALFQPSDPAIKNAWAFRQAVREVVQNVARKTMQEQVAAVKASLKRAPWEMEDMHVAC